MLPGSDPDGETITDGLAPSASEARTAARKDSLVGALVGGRYLIERELGRGGIGAVYLARDKPELMSRRVVVKVLLEDSLKNEWVVQKFRQEIESLTRLDEPGVVGIFDAGELEDGSPYLVMQYIEGASLRSEIRQGGMDFDRVANIISQIGRTLSAAHEKGIIHRDLKPENIMLRRATGGGDEQVKVIDFGIAKVKNSVIAPSTVTGEGVAGTISYMSPEQLSAGHITPASDIYALGIIAYEMLTGIKPFNPETSFQLLEMQRRGVRVSPVDLRPALPPTTQEVILRALAFEPKGRYQKARDFGDALAHALRDDAAMREASTLKPHKAAALVSEDKPSTSSAKQASSKDDVENPELQRKRKASGLYLSILVVVGLTTASIGFLLFRPLLKQGGTRSTSNGVPAAAAHTLAYSLTVQKMVRDEKTNQYKPLGEPFESTGQEIYGNGWEFHLNVTPAEAGSLYLLNEGAGPNDSTVYHVLFPTPANNNGVAELTAHQTMQTGQYFFNEYKGTEKLWIIWSEKPLNELEGIFKNAFANKLVVSDEAQIKTLRSLLARYDAAKTEVQSDKSKKQTTVKAAGDVLISLLELQHEQY